MSDYCKFYDAISFAHFIRLLEDAGWKYIANVKLKGDDIPFSITVEFWKE